MQYALPILGMGLGLWASSQMAKSQQSSYNQAISNMQSMGANLEAMPEVPTNPTLVEAATPEDETNIEAAEAAAETTQQAAAAAARYNPTGGTGLTGTTVGKKKTLAGV